MKYLSQEKKEQSKQIDQNKKLTTDVARLQILVKKQRQLLSELKPEKMRYLRNKSIHLQELHSAKALQDRHDKLKKEHGELKQRACTEKQTIQRSLSLRRVKAKLQKLQAEHSALQDHAQTEPDDWQQPQLRCRQNIRFNDIVHFVHLCRLSSNTVDNCYEPLSAWCHSDADVKNKIWTVCNLLIHKNKIKLKLRFSFARFIQCSQQENETQFFLLIPFIPKPFL